MQYNVSSLLREPTGTIREYDIDDELVVERDRHHVTGHVRFDRTPRGILVRARMGGTMANVCGRCVKPVTYDVEIEFDEECFPMIDIDSGARFELAEGENPEAYRIDELHVIDLSLPAAEYWLITQPMAPVCDEMCRGLCAECGADLGVASDEHKCGGDAGDARWSKLNELRLGS